MDHDPEFPIPTPSELRTIKEYLKVEEEFMADENYFKSYRRIRIREYGIRMIVRYSQGGNSNAFIPHLAMNYFDRFISRHPLPKILGSDKENVRLFAICCLTIAWKMRNRLFSVSQFLREKFLEIPPGQVLEMEFAILNGLGWRMRSITAFCFLNYYYPKYGVEGGFKRRGIHEIIVQSLEEMSMTHYKPSVIARSSFLAAANVLYGQKPCTANIDVNFCYGELLETCGLKNILIEPASWRLVGRSIAQEIVGPSGPVSIPGTSVQGTTSQRTQTISVPKTERRSKIVPSQEGSPKELWNFDLQWIKSNAEPEDQLDIPATDKETLEPQDTQGTRTIHSIIMSHLGANILNRIGCSNCNIL